MGSFSDSGHSTNSHTSLCGGSPRTYPCDGCTRIATKRDSNHPFVPCRQRIAFHPFPSRAASSTLMGRCLPLSWRVAGAPRPECRGGTVAVGGLVHTPKAEEIPTI